MHTTRGIPKSGRGSHSLGFLIVFPVLVTSGLLMACSDRVPAPDISGIEAGIEIMRFDADLFELDIDSIPEQIADLEDRYGDFFDIYFNLIIRIGNPASPAFPGHLRRFLTDFDIYRVKTGVDEVFPDLAWLEEDLERAFRYFMYYFPGYRVPDIYTYISGFNQSVVTSEGIIGIGLDKYLGTGHVFYSQLQLPVYQRQIMHPGKVVSDCMMAWAMMEFEFDDSEDNLLSHIIHHGKMLYFLDAVLPGQHDTLKTGFTEQQLQWCRRNENLMWTYLVENKLLFSADVRTISRFVNPAPFTREFTSESPGRAALWLGWQIVSSYMNRNRNVTLKELMEDTDYQRILNQARYRP